MLRCVAMHVLFLQTLRALSAGVDHTLKSLVLLIFDSHPRKPAAAFGKAIGFSILSPSVGHCC